MITRFLTDVSASLNPFSPRAKTVRSFLALLPANARSTMKVNVKMLPRTHPDPGSLSLQFSTLSDAQKPRTNCEGRMYLD